MKTNEMKFVVPKGWDVSEELMPDGSREFTIKPGIVTRDNTGCHQWTDLFRKVPASELRLDDEFLQYCPEHANVKSLKEKIEKAIKSGLKDFWRPVCDPSFDDDGKICYEPGKMPAVGKGYYWWEKAAKEFAPERGSRLGTETEYFAFLAVLIKELINLGNPAKWAWEAVCVDSRMLGHYRDSRDAKNAFELTYEPTGSRMICGWSDLANVRKIVNPDDSSMWFPLFGGSYEDEGRSRDLARCSDCLKSRFAVSRGSGWIVFTNFDTKRK